MGRQETTGSPVTLRAHISMYLPFEYLYPRKWLHRLVLLSMKILLKPVYLVLYDYETGCVAIYGRVSSHVWY